MRVRLLLRLIGCLSAALVALPASALALSTQNTTPFPASSVITGASWTSSRRGPPANQWGDILPITWANDDNNYVLMDDGGTDTPRSGALWRNSFARITGAPLHNLRFQRIGNLPRPATWRQIKHNRALWSGALGHHYATGFTSANGVFYATQDSDWNWGANGLFTGLSGVAYSTDRGQSWHFPDHPAPGATGNLTWVQRGEDTTAPDGYVYAISTEREFNASTLILSRSRPDVADVTNPANWQWATGGPYGTDHFPSWTSSIASTQPILNWPGHITYPRMSFDPGLQRYLLTFTYSYVSTTPGVWRNGSELVVLESPHPWGPFSFVVRGDYFGPSNGYDPEIPVKWISDHGRSVWLIWAANFDGCAAGLKCSAGYGFNYQRMQLSTTPLVSPDRGSSRAAAAGMAPPAPPRSWRGLPATTPVDLARAGLGF